MLMLRTGRCGGRSWETLSNTPSARTCGAQPSPGTSLHMALRRDVQTLSCACDSRHVDAVGRRYGIKAGEDTIWVGQMPGQIDRASGEVAPIALAAQALLTARPHLRQIPLTAGPAYLRQIPLTADDPGVASP